MNEAVCEALRILSENGCHGGGIWVKELKLPVDVVFDTFSGYEKSSGVKIPHDEGVTIKYGDINIVLYSPSWNVGRVNYTLAHEVGHIVLSHRGGAADEKQANLFASALLMPPCVVSLLKKKGAIRCARDTARFFASSLEAASIAYSRGNIVTPYDEKVISIYKKRIESFDRVNSLSLDIFDDI